MSTSQKQIPPEEALVTITKQLEDQTQQLSAAQNRVCSLQSNCLQLTQQQARLKQMIATKLEEEYKEKVRQFEQKLNKMTVAAKKDNIQS